MHQQGLNGLTDLKISIHTNTAIKLQFYKSCRGNFHYASVMSTDLGLSTGGEVGSLFMRPGGMIIAGG